MGRAPRDGPTLCGVRQVSCSYGVLWNAFKRLAVDLGCGAAGQRALLAGTAARVYGLPAAAAML